MLRLILIRGLPGSGKTTLAAKYRDRGFEHCEADSYFMRWNPNLQDYEYKFEPLHLADAHRRCQSVTLRHLMDGKSVVVANTFSQWWEMADYFMMAKETGAVCQIIETPGTPYKNVHGVPDSAINRMLVRWEGYSCYARNEE